MNMDTDTRDANPQVQDAVSTADTDMTSVAALQKFRIVVRAAQRHSAWIEKQCGVTGAQLWLLLELYETPQLRVGAIAERLAIHQTTASNMLNSLAKLGLVIKKRDSGDQRVVTLMLSQSGNELVERAPKPARGLLTAALGKMRQEHLNELNRGLQALLAGMDRPDDAFGLQPLPFSM